MAWKYGTEPTHYSPLGDGLSVQRFDTAAAGGAKPMAIEQLALRQHEQAVVVEITAPHGHRQQFSNEALPSAKQYLEPFKKALSNAGLQIGNNAASDAMAQITVNNATLYEVASAMEVSGLAPMLFAHKAGERQNEMAEQAATPDPRWTGKSGKTEVPGFALSGKWNDNGGGRGGR